MKKKRMKKEITDREMRLGILIAIFGAVVDFCFFGFSGYLILSLVVVYPLLYGYCASLYPAYGLIAEKLFRSETMLENMPDSALIFEPLRIVLVYALYFLGRRKK